MRQVQIRLKPVDVKRLVSLIKEENWLTRGGAVKYAKGVRMAVGFLLRLRRNEKVEAYLKKHGGTLTALIEKTVLEECDKMR